MRSCCLADVVLVDADRVGIALRPWVALGDGDERHARQVDLVVVVQVPVFLRGHEGVVRMRERSPQQEGPAVVAARLVVQPLLGAVGHLLVVVDLQVALAQPRFDHRAQAHARRGIGLAPARPVGGPAEVGRVDVGRHPLLEAVQLLGAGEVHLARQTGAPALVAQVMRQRQRRRRKVGGVVVAAHCRCQSAGEHRRARGRTHRVVAVGVEEGDAALGQPVHVRRGVGGAAVHRQHQGRQLVGLDDEDVGS